MEWNALAPAKHFILGEYAILEEDASALLMTHAPLFSMTARASKQGAQAFSHPASPAARLYEKYRDILREYTFAFHDPYLGMGGMGASSAEFLLLYQLLHQISQDEPSLFEMLETYYELTETTGVRPSGADVVAQKTGGLCAWQKGSLPSILDWKMSSIELHFVHTKHKVATHEHLQQFDLSFDKKDLKMATQSGIEAIKNQEEQAFIDAIQFFLESALSKNLVSEYSKEKISELHAFSWVKAAKGCGALGSDVLLIVTDRYFQDPVKQWANYHGMYYLCDQGAIWNK